MAQVCGRGNVFPSLPCYLFICWPESICSPIDPEGMRRWRKSFAHNFMPETQSNHSRSDGRKIYGEDEEAVWYLTKAMAASSLQNSSSTITPSRRVMWSMLRWQTREWEASSKRQLRRLQENTRTHIRDALRLQTQKSFPHEQQFGGEVWDTLNPHHEISDHLTHITKKVRNGEMPSCNTWQLLSVVVHLVTLNHVVCCFSYHIWCFTEEQTTRDNICVSVHHPADFRPACPCFWSKP